MTVGEITGKYPELRAVLMSCRVDPSLSGTRTLEEVARERNIDLDGLLRALNEAIQARKPPVRRRG
ncbi:MAG: hypothetical protein HYY29_03485 [Chloroflexi bacterium]|nr:hypothetical protein [Chloroflexota bacterium]